MKFAVLLAMALIAFFQAAYAEDLSENDKLALLPIERLAVLVEPFSLPGLSADTVQWDAKGELARSGVAILPDHTPGPYLYVNVNLMPLDISGVAAEAYSISVELAQPVTLPSGAVVVANTWSRGSVGVSSSADFIRQRVGEQVKLFATSRLIARQQLTRSPQIAFPNNHPVY